jgi:magnesium chelatase family protein
MNPPPANASAAEIVRYQKKISGPIMDRIDMWVNVLNIDYDKLGNKQKEGEESAVIKKRVLKARDIQKKRLEKSKARTNAEMGVKDIDKLIELKKEVKDILNDTAKRLGLSARAYHRVIKLARTIADLETSEHIEMKHVLEALQYRPRQD